MSSCSYCQEGGAAPNCRQTQTMSPRGRAIAGLDVHLFEAAERVLLRDGPIGLTGRAITREAGCATGLLYNHFGDFDAFLEAFILDGFRAVAERAAALPLRAGERTIVGNLTDAALTLPGSSGLLLPGLVQSRPRLSAAVTRALAGGAPGLQEIERAFAAYLDAERRIGRVADDADTGALAMALFCAVHHLWLEAGTTGLQGDQVKRLVAAIVAGANPIGTTFPMPAKR